MCALAEASQALDNREYISCLIETIPAEVGFVRVVGDKLDRPSLRCWAVPLL
jgi:hypothetical protein